MTFVLAAVLSAVNVSVAFAHSGNSGHSQGSNSGPGYPIASTN